MRDVSAASEDVVRRLRLLVAVALLLGACASPAATTTTGARSMAETTITAVAPTATTAPTSTTTTGPREPGWYVVSVTAALPEGFAAGLADIPGVDAVSTVRVGIVNVVATRDAGGPPVDEAPEGYALPLEAQSFDPGDHSAYVPPDVADVLDDLDEGLAVLSESSASFRRLGEDAELVLDDGSVLTVIGVVGDEWVGAAEIVLAPQDAERLEVSNERYSIVSFEGTRRELEQLANATTEAEVRVMSRDDVDVFRHADAVAAQIAIKQRFGEFAYRPADGDTIEIDPAWTEANIRRESVPLLGEVVCHVAFLELLRSAMTALAEAGFSDAVDPDAYAGCWYPRRIRQRTDLSRHAWGVAADINFWNEADESPGAPDDPRLVEALAAVGVRSGHAWTDPDPGHFEWFGPVADE